MGNLKSGKQKVIRQKGTDLNHVFYVVVGKQCRTENVYTISLYKLFNVFLLFIVLSFNKLKIFF